VIVQHQAECPAARLADWLDEAGASLVTIRPDLGARLPAPSELDGLMDAAAYEKYCEERKA